VGGGLMAWLGKGWVLINAKNNMRNIRIIDAGLGGKIDGWKVIECIKYVTRLLLFSGLGVVFLSLIVVIWMEI
jgi:hypothetical protein